MSDKVDLVYDIVKSMDERSREKAELDAARHTSEQEWRARTEVKLETFDNRLVKVEKPLVVWDFVTSRTGKLAVGLSALVGLSYKLFMLMGKV